MPTNKYRRNNRCFSFFRKASHFQKLGKFGKECAFYAVSMESLQKILMKYKGAKGKFTVEKCNGPHFNQVMELTSLSKGQINTTRLWIRHPETHCHFCSVPTKNTDSELQEEMPHKSDIGILRNN